MFGAFLRFEDVVVAGGSSCADVYGAASKVVCGATSGAARTDRVNAVAVAATRVKREW